MDRALPQHVVIGRDQVILFQAANQRVVLVDGDVADVGDRRLKYAGAVVGPPLRRGLPGRCERNSWSTMPRSTVLHFHCEIRPVTKRLDRRLLQVRSASEP